MTSEIVAFSIGIGILFIEDVFNFVKKMSIDIHRSIACHIKRHIRISIVRRIGFHLTWIEAPRLHIVWRGVNENCSSSDEDTSTNSYCQCSESAMIPSKYSAELETKINILEKELSNLQAQITKLLVVHENKLLVRDERNLPDESSSENIVSSTCVTSLPPPPPPPLPPTPLIQPSKTLIIQVKAKPPAKQFSTNNIMEELSKRPPKLRHVDLTPGGRPVRRVPTKPDPSDILTAVLKKRFEAIHSPKHEKSLSPPLGSPGSPGAFKC